MTQLKDVSFGVLCIVIIVGIYLTGSGFAQTLPQIPKKKGHPKLESVLFELTDIEEKKGPFHRDIFARERNIKIDDEDKVTLYIFSHPHSFVDLIDINGLKVYGIDVIKSANGVMKVRVPLNKIKNIADEIDGVTFLALPDKPYPQSVTSEGVSLTSASNYHSSGYTGQGVKIAVLDLGFQLISAAILSGDLPPNTYVLDCTGASCYSPEPPWDLFQTEGHGTAVAEIVHDMAPSAELYLVKVDDPLDAITAYSQFQLSNIRIVNHSVGWYNQNFGGGECFYSNAVCITNAAYSAGILWVNAAGNHAKHHYGAVFTDSNLNHWHDISPGVEVIRFYANYLDVIKIFLTWDAWPVTNQDYDLYLFDFNLFTLASSVSPQTGTQRPIESISYLAPYSGDYFIGIKRYSTTTNHRLSLFVLNHELAPHVVGGCIVSPAVASTALAVGAIDYPYWLVGPIASYSSQGPTSDGRIKPDIVAPASVSTLYYRQNGFPGTSAAAPHVAGAAALILSMNPTYTVQQLWNALSSSAIDMGLPGQDNVFGLGRLNMPPLPVSITVSTSIPGLQITVDGIPYTTPQTFYWAPGSGHTVGVSSPQSGGANTQYVFTSWSDGGASSHTITTPSSAMTYTAYFTTQYYMTTSVNPPGSATVHSSYYVNSGALVNLTAVPATGYVFNSWTGDCSSSFPYVTFSMTSPRTCTASLSACASQPVKVLGGAPYGSLQSAYDDDETIDGDTIQVLATNLTENVELNKNIGVTLQGGNNCNYTSNHSASMLTGSLTVGRGTVTIDGIILR